ncbi:MAG: site-specific integrase [Candidatus Obscuribacterales bacterium]|nr:site-specific integrase [Candidatus Obscuribacterales bacterium]
MIRKETETSLVQFREWMSTRNLSKNTMLSYNFRLEAYVRFRDEHAPGEDLTSTHLVSRFVKYLKDSNSSAATINQTSAALAKLFRFAAKTFPYIERMEKEPAGKRRLSEDDVRKLLDQIKHCGSLKARAIAMLCFDADLSASQCAGVSREDIVVCGDSVYLLIASRKRKPLVELVGTTKEVVLQMMDLEGTRTSFGPLFVNETGKRISRSGIDYLIKSVGIPLRLVLSAQLLRNSGNIYRNQLADSAKPMNLPKLSFDNLNMALRHNVPPQGLTAPYISWELPRTENGSTL